MTLGEREPVFGPFWRKTNTMPGLGLGLATAKAIIDRRVGRTWVEKTLGGTARSSGDFRLGVTQRLNGVCVTLRAHGGFEWKHSSSQQLNACAAIHGAL